MNVQPIHTHPITTADHQLLAILEQYIEHFANQSILAITSKIVALCQGRVAAANATDRQQLIEREADFFLPPSASRYQVTLTLKANQLTPNAGIDESNASGDYVLWPREPQAVADEVRAWLCQRFGLDHVGVILTDSTPVPLRWGVTGVAIAHSGFLALNDYRGQPDLFGRPLRMTKANVAQALATAAVLVMGEGAEGTPLAVISQLPFVQFQARAPSAAELQALAIEREDDLYAPLLTSVAWQRGRATR
ncbi:MAG: coenzyme F420-0:L-glutamate ligase [Caldilineaceae bacterium]|nr:coenzyme F420-0:L-glutamate ligase [Caldilineaceae bacterium]